jgi:hypothetical protein
MDLYNRNYLDTTLTNIRPLIYRMLNGHFVFNMYKKQKRSRDELSLNKSASPTISSDSSHDSEFLDFIHDTDYNPEELINISSGEEIVKTIIDNLSFIPYSTRIYTYTGVTEEGNEIQLTESNLAKLILSGYDLHKILQMFNVDVANIGTSAQASYIAHKVKAVIMKLSKEINELSDDMLASVKLFLNNIKRNKKLI